MTLEEFNKIARVSQLTRATAASNLFTEVISDYQRHRDRRHAHDPERHELAERGHHRLLRLAKQNLDRLTFT